MEEIQKVNMRIASVLIVHFFLISHINSALGIDKEPELKEIIIKILSNVPINEYKIQGGAVDNEIESTSKPPLATNLSDSSLSTPALIVSTTAIPVVTVTTAFTTTLNTTIMPSNNTQVVENDADDDGDDDDDDDDNDDEKDDDDKEA